MTGHALAVLGFRMTLQALAGADPSGSEAAVRKLLGVQHDQHVQEVGMALMGAEAAATDGEAGGVVVGVPVQPVPDDRGRHQRRAAQRDRRAPARPAPGPRARAAEPALGTDPWRNPGLPGPGRSARDGGSEPVMTATSTTRTAAAGAGAPCGLPPEQVHAWLDARPGRPAPRARPARVSPRRAVTARVAAAPPRRAARVQRRSDVRRRSRRECRCPVARHACQVARLASDAAWASASCATTT